MTSLPILKTRQALKATGFFIFKMEKKLEIKLPELSLVVLIGASGSGKSTFAREHFKATEILSSDACRGMVSDNENDQTVTKDAFELLRFIAAKRLEKGKIVVVDAT